MKNGRTVGARCGGVEGVVLVYAELAVERLLTTVVLDRSRFIAGARTLLLVVPWSSVRVFCYAELFVFSCTDCLHCFLELLAFWI